MGFLENLESSLNALVQSVQESSAIEEEKEINQKYKDIIKIYKNQNGKLRIVEVSDKCSACGACISYCDIFQDGPAGKCEPTNKGIILPDDQRMSQIMETIDLCPEQAISISNMSMIKENGEVTINDLKNYIKTTLVEYKCPIPKYKDFQFRGAVPRVDGDGIYGWSFSKYSSSSSAISAGLSELKRVYFNNMDSLSKGLLADYKHLVLTPLLSYEERRDNYYYFEMVRISMIINAISLEIKAITGKNVDESICNIEFKPDFGYKGKNFDSVINIEENLYGQAQQDVESASWYESWIDTDDYEDTKDTLFGYKTVTVYKYNTMDAWHEIEDHMKSGARSAVSDFFGSDYFKREFNSLVKPLEEEIRQKGEKLLEIL